MFRYLAKEAGLTFEWPVHKPAFYLDLNSGELYIPREPEKVLALVRLARECADSEDSGAHIAILDLVARPADIADISHPLQLVAGVSSTLGCSGRVPEYEGVVVLAGVSL